MLEVGTLQHGTLLGKTWILGLFTCVWHRTINKGDNVRSAQKHSDWHMANGAGEELPRGGSEGSPSKRCYERTTREG